MFVFSAFWGGVRLALDDRIPTPVPLSRKLLSLSNLRNMVSYVQFLFKFSLYSLFSNSFPTVWYSFSSLFADNKHCREMA